MEKQWALNPHFLVQIQVSDPSAFNPSRLHRVERVDGSGEFDSCNADQVPLAQLDSAAGS